MNGTGKEQDISAEAVPSKSGWVYFIDSGEAVKIGYSTDVDKRLNTLQAGTHQKLTLIGKVPGTLGLERRYHARFANVRIRGEWFESCGPVLCAIDLILKEAERRR